MDDNVREGNLAHELEAGHDHPAHPEIDDLARRAVDVGRIEGLQVVGLFRPAERRKRPQGGRKPRVENVGVLLEPRISALGARVGPVHGHGLMAVGAVVHGDAMAKPELAADVPVAKPSQPVEICALVPLGMPAHLAGLRRRDGLVAHLGHLQPPLLADQRLDDRVASVAVADLVRVGLLFDQQALRLQLLDDALACSERRHSVVGEAGHVHAAVFVHGVDDLEAVPLPDLVVHRVVPGRDLQRAGAEVLLHRVVGDYRQPAADERQGRRLAGQVLVALVVRVHGDSRVRKHRLRPDGRDGHEPAFLHRVVDEVERVLVLLPLDLEVRDGGAVVRAPVHDPGRAVDPAALVKGDERGHHRAVVARVHREAKARPVHRRAQQPQLVDDRRPDLLVPGVHAGVEPSAAQLFFGGPFSPELLLDHVLGGDCGVVVAGQEEHLVAGHPLVAGEEVVDGRLEGVPHVQLAGDVRRRKAHRELLPVAVGVGDEQSVRLPARVPAGLDGLRIKRFRHLRHGGVLHRFGWFAGAGRRVAVSATEAARVLIRALSGSWCRKS